jgi:hypothetical protein
MYSVALIVTLLMGPAPSAVFWTGTAIGPIDRVEEDWELVLASPDIVACGPQITTTMSPVGDTQVQSMSFNLNYRDDPFATGGLQLRAWDGSSVAAEDSRGSAQCETQGEVITWTQEMSLSGGQLVYVVKDGSSTTWGEFGRGEQIRVTVSTSLTSLDAYQSEESVDNSGPGWQSNRVASMRLVRVRRYSGGQLASVDETPRVIIAEAP